MATSGTVHNAHGLIVTWYLHDKLSRLGQTALDATIRLNLSEDEYSSLVVSERFVSLETTEALRSGILAKLDTYMADRDIMAVTVRTKQGA